VVTDRDELDAWLRLLSAPDVGREGARRLLAAFGSAEQVFAASSAARSQVVGSTLAHALSEASPDHERRVQAVIEWLGVRDGAPRSIVTLGDPEYPPALLETADPPLLLYAQGRVELLREPAIAIVGSRNPTPQGQDNARAFARHLSEAGMVVVSGLALGIDGAAHEGALLGPSGTIAVVGTGVDRVYPASHRDLAHRIARNGLIVSEYPLGTPPLAGNFPQRNRIIAGLARGTLVVEAALQSGSLITARLAAEAGREVFAIPGSIHSPQSRGCHALIRQGAKLVETARDLLDELHWPVSGSDSRPGVVPADADGDPLLVALGQDPVSLDALVARTGWPAATLAARLLELEMQGRVARLPGQLFQRRAHG
jgi:DNA processing protein